jgi:hypothetical protein
MKERESKTILPPNRIGRCARGDFHGPASALPRCLPGSSLKNIPDSATELSGLLQTWRPDAMFSTKNQFKIPKTVLNEKPLKRHGADLVLSKPII